MTVTAIRFGIVFAGVLVASKAAQVRIGASGCGWHNVRLSSIGNRQTSPDEGGDSATRPCQTARPWLSRETRVL